MRTLLLSLFALAMSITVRAQYYVATFDTLSLPQADTYYVNYTQPMQDVGFDDGLAHFPCVYDTSWGGLWEYGFSYSNMTDSTTSGYTNSYAARTAIGYNSSANYATVSCPQYAPAPTRILFSQLAPDSVLGFYVTNSTYAYNSMRDGDGFAKKFGGASANDPDWFRLTVKGYWNGALKQDSVDFYLADFRDANNANDYIVKDWQWVNLTTLGAVDSLEFILNSSDTAGGNGMNTPAYFCIDNLVSVINPINVPTVGKPAFAAKMYPNPATDALYIEPADASIRSVEVYDATGKLLMNEPVTGKALKLNTASLPAGLYMVRMRGNAGTASSRFIKR
jgi:hypothetical protein